MRRFLLVLAVAAAVGAAAVPAASPSITHDRQLAWRVLHAVWGSVDRDHDGRPDAAEAFRVVGCETGYTYNPMARGGFHGWFQDSDWWISVYGWSNDPWWQARENLRAWIANGRCWVCNSQWPTCGRGLD